MLTFGSFLPMSSRRFTGGMQNGPIAAGGSSNHRNPERRELARILAVHVGGGCVECNLDAIRGDERNEAVHTLWRGLQSHCPGTPQPVGGGIDADHPYRIDHGASLRLVK